MRLKIFTVGCATAIIALLPAAPSFAIGKEVPPAAIPAFPGAEGFGMYAQGGRGGKVYTVTNLEDSGPGSLREAVEAQGPRTVVFAVSGTIALKSDLQIKNDYITIAGQTAPGGGILVRNYPLQVAASHVIIRHIRSRLGAEAGQEADSIWVSDGKHIILDHVSASWSTDESLSVSHRYRPDMVGLDHVTIQWSVIANSLNRSIHAKGDHGYGTLARGSFGARYSFHHNLWASHSARMPRPGNYESAAIDPVGVTMDFRNNVFFNWKGTGKQGASGYNADKDARAAYNFINNYYVPGPDSKGRMAFDEGNSGARAFFAGNYMAHQLPSDPWSLVSGLQVDGYRQSSPIPVAPVETDSAPDAFRAVLHHAGAAPRDAVDIKVVDGVRNENGRIINNVTEAGGWPELASGVAPTDSDGDGMPDEWELAHTLNPHNAADGVTDRNGDGYTNLEEYLNERAVRLVTSP